MEHYNRPFNAPGEGIDDGGLLDEELRHVDTERRACNLQLGMKVRTLLWSYLNRAGHKDHPQCGFSSHCEQFLQRRIDAGNRPQGSESSAVSGMHVIVLVELREFLVRLVRQREPATATLGRAAVVARLIPLTTIAAAD